MNKSKFLKKSLAMLLSVLMIVAMIPLGASAAESDVTPLQAIYINGVTVSVANKTFKANITNAATCPVEVRGLYEGEKAWVEKIDGDWVQVSTDDTTTTVPDLDLTKFEKEGNVYTIPLILTSADETNVDDSYTIQLTVVPVQTTTELATAKATKAFSTKISGLNINIQVPLGYDEDGVLTLTAKDNAKIESAGATVADKGDGTYEVDGYANGDTIKVRSQSTGNTVLYTVYVTEIPVLEEFQAGDVAAKIVHDFDDDPNPSISATYPGDVLVKPRTEYDPPAKSLKTTFKAPAGAVVELVKADGTKTALTSGKSYDYIDAAKDAKGNFQFLQGASLDVTCKEVKVTYPITFNTEADTVNKIYSATVDGEVANVPATGNKITANVQKKLSTNPEIVLVSSPKATINIQTKTGTTVVADLAAGSTNADGNGVFTTSAATVAQLKEGLIVVVTSQAGKNNQYELKITATGDVDTTELTSFALRIGTETYTGTVNKTARTVAVTVPYLTTDDKLAAANLIVTTNAYVKACKESDGTTPATTGTSIGLEKFDLNTRGTSGTAVGKIWAVSKTGSAPATEYTVTVTLETAKAGNTLTSLVATSANHWKASTNDNSYTGSIKTNADKSKTVTINPAYSECQAASKPLFLKSYATAPGGVAFLGTTGAAGDTLTEITGELDSYNITDVVADANAFVTMASGVVTDKYIWVLPEIDARKQRNPGDTPSLNKATAYKIVTESKPAEKGVSLSNIKLGTTTLGSSLSGTIPYSMTVAAGTQPDDTNTYFADDFSIALRGTLGFNTKGTDSTTIGTLTKGGDTTGDGVADASSQTNAKFFFERQANNTVKVSAWWASIKSDLGITEEAQAISHMTVIAENIGFQKHYPIGTIKYAQPNTDAFITAFSVAGSNGTIKNEGYDNWSIKVTVPMDTKLTNLVPTFTASAGATVTLTDEDGNVVKSGETSIDFSEPVVLVVSSEDEGGKRNTYTVTVTAADGFIDVAENSWYYNNVMAAYNAGYISGTGNGKFAPTVNVTRRDFAIMVYKMLGGNTTNETSFADVKSDDYGRFAIAFLKDNDIVSGDGDTGNFRPNNNISRQEAASILAKAKKLTGTSDTTFADDAKIASWAKNAVYACKAAGVITGDKGTNTFRPADNIIRAEAASMVLNAASK